MKNLVKIDDYASFLNLLPENFKKKEQFKKFLNIFLQQCNEIETAIFELMNEFDLNTAIGVQLDIIGKILGLSRDGRDDIMYRTLLKIKAKINSGAGTPEALIETVLTLYNATRVELQNVYPAKVQIWQDGDIGLYLKYTIELDDSGLLELDDGGLLEVWLPDEISEKYLFDVLPAGVDLIFAEFLELDDGGLLELDDGKFLIITR